MGRAQSLTKNLDKVSYVSHLRWLLDSEQLREIRRKDLKSAIEKGIDSEDAGLLEEVVAKYRAKRAATKDRRLK